ncbi:MAG: peptidylprolyl isomerase [Chloroflexi bacterium]|nr:peptidylprolyl isomerase [Chloroflexota bacterium]
MAKRSKRSRVATKPEIENKKHAVRRQKDVEATRRIYIWVGGVVALLVLVFGVGLVQRYILVPRTPVATVGDKTITLAEFQDWVKYRAASNPQLKQELLPSTAPDTSGLGGDTMREFFGRTLADELVQHELMRTEAQKRGITVTPAEIDAEIQSQFGYDPQASASVTSTGATSSTVVTKEDFDSQLGAYLKIIKDQAGFSENDFREKVIVPDLLRKKLTDAISADIPTSVPQVHLKHIEVDSQDKAGQVLANLQAGQTFDKLAADMSTDNTTKDKGGDLGWIPEGDLETRFGKDFATAISTLEPGKVSGIIAGQSGNDFHVAMVVEKDANRALTSDEIDQRKQQAFTDWIQKAESDAKVDNRFTLDMLPAFEGQTPV